MIDTTIQIGGITIPAHPIPGVPWWFSGLVDWYTRSDDKMPTTERPQAHGAFTVSRSLRSAQAISFTVHVVADTEAAMLAASTQLAGIGTDAPVPMRVQGADGVTERVVSVRRIQTADHHGREITTLTFDCLARDPLRYSVDDLWTEARPPAASGGLIWPLVSPLTWPGGGGSDGRVTIGNRGTVSSWPVYRVAGGFAGFTLTEIATHRAVGLDFTIPSGSVVELDFATRTAIVDGQGDVSRYLTARGWWDVPAGTSVTAQIDVRGPVGDPTFAGMVRSAW